MHLRRRDAVNAFGLKASIIPEIFLRARLVKPFDPPSSIGVAENVAGVRRQPQKGE
jgi:hypothetical protein